MLALLAAACGHPERDNLTRIIRLADTDHEAAAVALDSVDTTAFSEYDRNLYSLIRIKIADKSYQKHKSADEIEQVIDYFRRHTEDFLYAEALYYAGRVNSDMGDRQMALMYFNEAEKALEGDTSNYILWGNIMSQTGRLLDDIRDYSDSRKYIKRVIQAERQRNDFSNLVYDTDLLGFSFLHSGDHDSAMLCFKDAYALAEHISPDYCLRERMLIAYVHNYRDRMDSALLLIRGIPEKITKEDRSLALALASDIYYRNEIYDTAYVYARQLSDIVGDANRAAAFKTLLKPGVVGYVHPDSVYGLVSKFSEIVQDNLYNEGDTLAAINLAKYNYDKRENRLKASEKKLRYTAIIWILIIMTTIVATTIIIHTLRKRSRQQLNESIVLQKNLQREVDNLMKQLETLSRENPIRDSESTPNPHELKIVADTDSRLQRDSLIDQLIQISNQCPDLPLSETLINSDVYKQLPSRVEDAELIPERYTFWSELEAAVTEAYPNFMDRLYILTNGQIDSIDKQIAMLTKCSVKLSIIAKIIGRGKSATSIRRRELAKSISSDLSKQECSHFGDGIANSKWFEDLIRLL